MSLLVNDVLRHLKVYHLFLKFSMQDVLVYRMSGLLMGLAPIVWMTTVIIFLVTIFTKISNLGGWNFWEIVLLTGVHEVIFISTWSTTVNNLSSLSDDIRTGRLDLALMKPISPRFLVSFRNLDFTVIGSLISNLIIFIIAFNRAVVNLDFFRVLGFALLLIMAYWITYYVYFIFASFSLYLTSTRYLFGWIGELTDFDRYPAEIYNSSVRLFFLFFLPILFFAYVPTAFLLGKVGGAYIFGGIAVIFVLHIISAMIWRLGLRRYQSASS